MLRFLSRNTFKNTLENGTQSQFCLTPINNQRIKIFLSCYERGTKKKFRVPHEESNVRPSDSVVRCSTTKPQRLYGEQGLLRSSEDTLPSSCWDHINVDSVMFVTKYFIYKLIIVWDFLDMDQCVVFLGMSLYSQSVSLYFGV